MFSDERKKSIQVILDRNGRVQVDELAEKFQVSKDSIRRDLADMESKGIVKRTYGGAIPVTTAVIPPAPEHIRYNEDTEYVHPVAQKAAEQIKTGDCIVLSGASLHFELAKLLRPDMKVTVITNAIKIADYLRKQEDIDCILLGGRVKKSGNISDVLTLQMAEQFHADICFITGAGLSENGISFSYPETAAVSSLLARQAQKVICIADHQKWERDAFVACHAMSEIDMVISEKEMPLKLQEAVKRHHAEMVLV